MNAQHGKMVTMFDKMFHGKKLPTMQGCHVMSCHFHSYRGGVDPPGQW